MKVMQELFWRYVMLTWQRVAHLIWLCNLRRPVRVTAWISRRWIQAARRRRGEP